uniref:Uncharacterized protein n=1 Tax=Megaselia scalaris TaxID=36166 RepID=T1GG28_MEGSC
MVGSSGEGHQTKRSSKLDEQRKMVDQISNKTSLDNSSKLTMPFHLLMSHPTNNRSYQTKAKQSIHSNKKPAQTPRNPTKAHLIKSIIPFS